MKYETKESLAISSILLYLLLIILMCIGWVLNVVKLLGMWDQEVTTLFILRIVGVVVGPFGAILGWFF